MNKLLRFIKNKILILSLVFCYSSTALIGCAGSNDAKIVTEINKKVVDKYQPPFTEITLDSTEEAVLKAEGEAVEEYPSFYQGTVYRYDNKEYVGYNGSLKYMSDDKGNIACIAWMYESENAEDVNKAYETIHNEMIVRYGESGNVSEAMGNYGDIWYFDNVHIQISAVVTSDYNGLQISYMDAEYSLKDKVDQKKLERENGTK